MVLLRNANENDFSAILHLNDAVVQQTSPMDLDGLRFLHSLACFHQVATIGGQVAGFLLTLREGTVYQSDNYLWFQSRYPQFIYIDRVVVGAEFAGQGVGSSLYRALLEFAAASDISVVACEFNLEPPNPASRAFHARFGFREVGIQRVSGGTKLVSLQVVDPHAHLNPLAGAGMPRSGA